MDLGLPLLHAGLRDFDIKFQFGVLGPGHFNLLIQRSQRRFGIFQGQPVIGGINFKQHVAGFHRLVVLDVELDDLAGPAGGHADDVGFRNRIIGARMPLDDAPNPEGQHHHAGNGGNGDDGAGDFAPIAGLGSGLGRCGVRFCRHGLRPGRCGIRFEGGTVRRRSGGGIAHKDFSFGKKAARRPA